MSSTKCPNCGKKLTRDFCMHCGYMTSGIFIDVKKPKKITDIEVYLDNRYDKMNRNKNSFVPFFLGPLYFCYNKFLLAGLLAMLFDFLFCTTIKDFGKSYDTVTTSPDFSDFFKYSLVFFETVEVSISKIPIISFVLTTLSPPK